MFLLSEYSPNEIILAGDSAGGGMVVRYAVSIKRLWMGLTASVCL